MKREIKFRAFLNSKYYEKPCMLSWGDLLEQYDAIDMFQKDLMTLMQYTGLHDKNGREIYESDIVHVWDNGTAVVKFDESLDRGQWMCEFIPDEHNAETWSAPLFDWLDGNVDGSVFEIMGNIYENPELLEASK